MYSACTEESGLRFFFQQLLLLVSFASLAAPLDGSTDVNLTSRVPSSTTTFPAVGPATAAPKSDWEKIGLPIVLLIVVFIVFALVHAAVYILPETKCWKRLLNYQQLEQEDTSNMSKILRRRVKTYFSYLNINSFAT